MEFHGIPNLALFEFELFELFMLYLLKDYCIYIYIYVLCFVWYYIQNTNDPLKLCFESGTHIENHSRWINLRKPRFDDTDRIKLTVPSLPMLLLRHWKDAQQVPCCDIVVSKCVAYEAQENGWRSQKCIKVCYCTLRFRKKKKKKKHNSAFDSQLYQRLACHVEKSPQWWESRFKIIEPLIKLNVSDHKCLRMLKPKLTFHSPILCGSPMLSKHTRCERLQHHRVYSTITQEVPGW